jgi:hyperosmotically inducible periplasmic protein
MNPSLNLKRTSLAFVLMSLAALNAAAFDTDDVADKQVAYGEQFDGLDTDGNGVLSLAEVEKDKSFNKAHFVKADADHDGTLDKHEYGEAKSKMSKVVVERVATDSWITTKAKAQLLAEESLKSLKISVETHKGIVILSGFVSDISMKNKAEEVVSHIEGVKSVKNSIVVKS